MIQQRTIAKPVSTSGIGIHTGQTINITLRPAEIDTGIIFNRVDLDPPVQIPATTEFVGDTRLNTTLSKGDTSLATVEHIISAFAGLGIDNAYIDIDGIELPVMDGSALEFVSLIQTAGIKEQAAPKKFLRIKHKITVEDGDKSATLTPFDGAKFTFTISFDHPAIRSSNQTAEINLVDTTFADAISRARTFGFLSDYEYLKKNNLAKGASFENTVVLDDEKVMNEEGLRYEDEFVRHKILDAIGDLYLLGHNIIGAFEGHKSGHALTHQLRQMLLSDPTAWELTTWDGPIPKSFEI